MTTYNLYSNNKIILRQTKNYSVYLTLTDSNIFLFNNFAQFTSFKNFELVLEKIDGLVLVDLKNSYTKLFNTFLKENKLENIVISKTPYISTNGNSLTLILLDLKKKKQKKK
jgi:hypothetical protein